eukprot:2446322-Rhodomonas_salina.1
MRSMIRGGVVRVVEFLPRHPHNLIPAPENQYALTPKFAPPGKIFGKQHKLLLLPQRGGTGGR